MFVLSDAHESAFAHAMREVFIEELAAASYDSLPDEAPFLSPDARLSGAELVFRNAGNHGYSTRGGLFFWLNLATILGSHFHSDPQFAQIAPPRQPPHDPQEQFRLSQVYDAVAEYISAVHGGPENTHYTQAGLDFAACFDGTAPVSLSNDTDAVARKLAEIYPQKFERHGTVFQEKLANGSYHSKAVKLLASERLEDILFIAGTEMFFGHRFEIDAFKPWIGDTLANSKAKTNGAAPDLDAFFATFCAWIDPDDT